MTEKTKTVGPSHVDLVGLKKIWKSFLISAGGAAIVGLGSLVNVIDLGSWQPLLIAFVPWVVNTLKVWLGTYESKVD
jgi:hypothetical protein